VDNPLLGQTPWLTNARLGTSLSQLSTTTSYPASGYTLAYFQSCSTSQSSEMQFQSVVSIYTMQKVGEGQLVARHQRVRADVTVSASTDPRPLIQLSACCAKLQRRGRAGYGVSTTPGATRQRGLAFLLHTRIHERAQPGPCMCIMFVCVSVSVSISVHVGVAQPSHLQHVSRRHAFHAACSTPRNHYVRKWPVVASAHRRLVSLRSRSHAATGDHQLPLQDFCF